MNKHEVLTIVREMHAERDANREAYYPDTYIVEHLGSKEAQVFLDKHHTYEVDLPNDGPYRIWGEFYSGERYYCDTVQEWRDGTGTVIPDPADTA
jgi:hypothetical protein